MCNNCQKIFLKFRYFYWIFSYSKTSNYHLASNNLSFGFCPIRFAQLYNKINAEECHQSQDVSNKYKAWKTLGSLYKPSCDTAVSHVNVFIVRYFTHIIAFVTDVPFRFSNHDFKCIRILLISCRFGTCLHAWKWRMARAGFT